MNYKVSSSPVLEFHCFASAVGKKDEPPWPVASNGADEPPLIIESPVVQILVPSGSVISGVFRTALTGVMAGVLIAALAIKGAAISEVRKLRLFISSFYNSTKSIQCNHNAYSFKSPKEKHLNAVIHNLNI